MEFNFDDSLPRIELEKTNDHKENNESDSPKINPRPEVENNNGKVAVMSDPDLVICTAGGLKGSTSAVIPEVDNRKALVPPSPSALPLPLPPKRHQRSPAFEETLSQGPQLKAVNKENKPLNSPPDEESDMAETNRNCTSTVSAKSEPMILPQPPTNPHRKCPPKLPIKPPQLFSSMRAGIEVEKERRKQEDEQWREVNGGMINPMGTDSNMETLKWTENNKEIQRSGQGVQDSKGISKLPSGHLEGTEVVGTKLDPCQLELKRLEDTQEIAETLPGGELKQTKQKTNASGMVKQFAKKVMGRLKEGREEKSRIKEKKMDGVREDDFELTQDERRHGEEGGMKDEEEEEGMNEVAVDQSETQSHVDLMERIKRRNATSESPFSSFKVCSPVKLVEELLSGDEWSLFLYREQSSTPDPPPHLTHSEDTGQLSVDQFNSSAELDLALDVFGGNPAVPEDIDLSNIMTEEQGMNRAPITAIPNILVESETDQLSPRTKDIYNTVEFIEPVQPVNTNVYFSDIKSQGVLDSAVQKYLIKLSKKRKHRAAQKQSRSHAETFSTSPQQVFTASIFYNIPASGGDEQQQLSTVKCGGSSPRSLAKIKKDKTMLRAEQPKEDRGK